MNPYINTLRTPLSSSTHPPQTSSNQWRCPHHRLHLDGQDCVPISPDSPIIDTPSKYRKMQARRTAALPLTNNINNNSNSQATTDQPTPSGPPARLQDMTPEERASANFALQENGEPLVQEEDQDLVDQGDSQNFLIPSSPPSHHHHDAVERVPETPMADLPFSPPLPLLTSANLRQLNSQPSHGVASGAGAHSSSSHGHPYASSPVPPPSVLSLPSEVAHRISRLVLRTQINELKHAASEEQLEATRGALETALALVQHEASRVDTWMGAAITVLLLCWVYVAWCQYNSAEFAFIEECRREWFGL